MKTQKTCLCFCVMFLQIVTGALFANTRWHILPERGICWNVQQDIPHFDHVEMSGEMVSAVLRYGVSADGSFHLERSLIWPMLRTVPNNTHASLMQRFAVDVPSLLMVNGLTIQQQTVKSITLNGMLSVVSEGKIGYVNTGSARKQELKNTVRIQATLFPSTNLPALCETYQLTNITNRPIVILVPDYRAEYKTPAERGVEGSYTMVVKVDHAGTYTLQPNETICFGVSFQAYNDAVRELQINSDKEMEKRMNYVNLIGRDLVLKTPNDTINTMFEFAKIRASESIFKTKGGYMHAPGGESYYAAIWANDQAEYVNPFFPFLGYPTGNESAMNSFRHFARFMNESYNPLPSSIIAEGTDIWAGVGDRGDAAMVAYGAARYALARGNRQEAEELWTLIEWCLEYCHRKINADGVVASNTDELEFRFPAGDANLCTSSLYYDALLSASYLGKSLNKANDQTATYRQQAQQLRKNIEKFFGAEVEGFDTYRYYRENEVLRSWICMPLTVGIYDRAEATIQALLSSRLWASDGLLTQAGSSTFWDRSTLYALRGLFQAGATENAIEYLNAYSVTRLLGNHVPYAIEAWPEGNQRHLSAESGLYCRIITEGLFGIRPTGLRSFVITPRLPEAWNTMMLQNIRAFNDNFDLQITRAGKRLKVNVLRAGKVVMSKNIADGGNVEIKL